jgi:hypothetical protein
MAPRKTSNRVKKAGGARKSAVSNFRYDARKIHIPRIYRPASADAPLKTQLAAARSYTPWKAAQKISNIRAVAKERQLLTTLQTVRPQAVAEVSLIDNIAPPAHSTRASTTYKRRSTTPSIRTPAARQTLTQVQSAQHRISARSQTPIIHQSQRARSILKTPRVQFTPDIASSRDQETEDEDEDEEENEEEFEEGNISLNSEVDAHQMFYNQKEAYKQRVGAQRIAQAQRQLKDAQFPITTSEAEEAMEEGITTNYHLLISLHLILNKSTIAKRQIGEFKRRDFELDTYEEMILAAFERYTKGVPFEIERRTAVFRVGKAARKVHDFEDFGEAESEKLIEVIDAAVEYSRSRATNVELAVEIRGTYNAKAKPPTINVDSVSEVTEITSSPPIPKDSKLRSGKLLEQQQIRRNRIYESSGFQKSICERWKCTTESCINYLQPCFRPSLDSSDHFRIRVPQQEAWANALLAGTATLEAPPYNLVQYWLEEGAIGRLPRVQKQATIAQQTLTATQQTQSSVFDVRQQMAGLMNFQMEQELMKTQQDTLRQQREDRRREAEEKRREERQERKRQQREEEENEQEEYQRRLKIRRTCKILPSIPNASGGITYKGQ